MPKITKYKTLKRLKRTESFRISSGTTGVIDRIVFPNEVQVGLNHNELRSNLVVFGNIVSRASGSTSGLGGSLSGSLTRLSTGLSYIVAGSNVTITSGSTGQVTIAAAGGSGSPGGSDTQLQYNDGGSFGGISKLTWDDTNFLLGASATTKLQFRDSDIYINSPADGKLNIGADNQVLIMSGGGATSNDESSATDVSFYVSGSTSSFGVASGGVSVFGGDTYVSGGMRVEGVLLSVAEYIDHLGDPDTFIRFTDDDINIQAGGRDMIKITENNVQDTVIFNDGGADVDFRVESVNEPKALFLDANGEAFHINFNESNFDTKIHNTNDLAISVTSAGVVLNEDSHASNDFRVESDNNTHMLFVDAGTDKVGINTNSPTHTLSVAGVISASLGLSGSLTRLVDGTSYLSAGTNVTITSASNGQVTIASTGAASDSFKTIAVSGQSDVIADSSTDTLTLAEGSNITITTNAANDTITFAAAAGGGGGSGDYQTKSANFTVGTSEYMFGISTSGGAVTGTLPAAASAASGKQYIFKDAGGYAGNPAKGIHIATDSNSETIDGAVAASILVNSGSISVMTDGSDWFVMGVS